MRRFLIMAALAVPMVAQQPQSKPTATQTEQLAIAQLKLEIDQVEQNISKFEAEYAKTHPGWQVNVRTGEPEPLPVPKAEVKPPEPKK